MAAAAAPPAQRTRVEMRGECLRWVEAALQLRSRQVAAERDAAAHWTRAVAAAKDLYAPLKDVRAGDAAREAAGQEWLSRRAKLVQTVKAARDRLLDPVKQSQHWRQDVQRVLAGADRDLAAAKQEGTRALLHLTAEEHEVEGGLAEVTAMVEEWAAEAPAGGGTPRRARTPTPSRGGSATPARHGYAQTPRLNSAFSASSPAGAATPRPARTPSVSGRRAATPTRRAASASPYGLTPSPGASPQAVTAPQGGGATPPEVLAYQRFMLQSGGATGGWQGEEHAAFLKVLAEGGVKGCSEEAVLSRLEVALQMERDVVFAHLKWHEREQALLEAKRAAIVRWQQHRQMDAMNAQALTTIEQRKHAPAEQRALRAKQEREQAKRDRQAEELKEWRSAKARAAEEEEEQRAETRRARRDDAKARDEARAKQREEVAEYQRQKRSEREAKARAAREKSTPATPRADAAEALLQLRARDSEIVRQRRDAVALKDTDRTLAEKRARQRAQAATVKRTAERSFSRLTQPTIASHQRAEGVAPADAADCPPQSEILLRGPQYSAPVPTRVTGRATVAWCGARHLR